MTTRGPREPIAITGMGCRFPGAEGVDGYWDLLLEGVDALEEVPAARFDIEAYYDPRPETPGRIATRRGGFVDDLRDFDASLFGISSREAQAMDPQQRKLLEVVWRAFESAGYGAEGLEGTSTGVFVGCIANEYRHLMHGDGGGKVDVYSESGSSRAAASGRVSHVFGLNGPSLTLDAACSSSLYATHLACQSIWHGHSEHAVAAGANAILQPEASIAFSSTGMLAGDGRCKFGDAGADGFVRSDGFGAVLFEPLEAAIDRGAPVRAVVRTTAANNDGRTGKGFFLTPSREGQRQLIEAAYGADEGIEPGDVDYVEAHGTGTPAGDPAEIGALADVLAQRSESADPLWVGSAKTNIGHTEGAAGVAGLIKLALVLERGVVPPSLHYEKPNPEIEWSEIGLEIPTGRRELERERPRLGAVSSFGISGSNAHVVLEEWQGAGRAPSVGSDEDAPMVVVPVSAHTAESLSSTLENYARELDRGRWDGRLSELAAGSADRRSHRAHRAAVAGRDPSELADQIERAADRCRPSGAPAPGGPGRGSGPVFAFSGQGGQWPGMGRGWLRRSRAFEERFDACDRIVRDRAGWSVRELLEDERPFGGIDRVQPALFAVQVALAGAWRELGVEPTAVVGHSVGEAAAAHVAGALSLEEAARVVLARSRRLATIAGDGAMGFVGASPDQVEAHLAEREEAPSLAVRYGPGSTVVSGRPTVVEEVLETFDERGQFVRRIDVDVASHSSQVEPLVDPLGRELSGLTPSTLEVPMVSTVTGRELEGGELGADYWADHLRRPVRFQTAVAETVAGGGELFLEIGPHPTLAQPIRQTVRAEGGEPTVLASLEREGESDRVAGQTLSMLYEGGCDVDWTRLDGGRGDVSLPAYAFDRETYWYDQRESGRGTSNVRRRPAGGGADQGAGSRAHPLLQRRFTVGPRDQLTIWEATVDVEEFAYLADHRLRGNAVFPGAGYVEMVTAAGRRLIGPDDVAVSDATFEHVLLLPSSGEFRMQVAMEQIDESSYRAEVYSITGEDLNDPSLETELHFAATVGPPGEETGVDADALASADALSDAPTVYEGREHYRRLERQGLENGPTFETVQTVRVEGDAAEVSLEIPPAIEAQLGAYVAHPAVMDGWFQIFGPLLADRVSEEEAGEVYLPSRLEHSRVVGEPTRHLRGRARLVGGDREDADHFVFDIAVYDDSDQLIAEFGGLRVERVVSADQRTDPSADWFYRLAWRDRDLPPESEGALEGRWVVLGDRGELGDRVADRIEQRGASCERIGPGELDRAAGGRPDAASVGARAAPVESLLEPDVGAPLAGIVFARSRDWGRDVTGDPFERVVRESMELVEIVQRVKEAELEGDPRLYALTGAESGETADAVQGAVDGLLRTVRNEIPSLEPAVLELSETPGEEEVEAVVGEFAAETDESEVALNGERRAGRRLEPLALGGRERRRTEETVDTQGAFELEPSETGGLGDIRLRGAHRRAPDGKEIEVDVAAAGVNFADVVSAIGAIDETDTGIGRLGYGCVGRVGRRGSEVGSVEVGDRVMAIGPRARCFGGFATLDARLAAPIPASLDFVEAATVPTAFTTAWYALIEEGDLERGDRVLIHSASGGVGHAALQIASHVGADVLATAGTERKRDYLRRTFEPAAVADSRSEAFVDTAREWTDGRGVDHVLNSVTGELLEASLDVLGPFGRFLDLTKSAMSEDGSVALERFDRNVSYTGVELTRVAAHGPERVARMWRSLVEGFEEGIFEPLPVDRTFPVGDVGEAFRYMSRGEHIGKIVVETEVGPVDVERPMRPADLFEETGGYLLTGGTGGLGLEFAEWMVDRGAGRLVLMSRSGADERARERIDALEARGAEVVVEAGDVTRTADLEAALDRACADEFELRGVFHLAAVLADATIENQSRASFDSAMRPKAGGALRLHRVVEAREADLDYFVLFSSAAGILGSPGQSNYAAASTVLDAIARRRRASGRPALSIDWGNWAEVGLAAARGDRGERLESRGLERIDPEAGVSALERALLHEMPPQFGIFGADWNRWAQACPGAASSPTFRHLIPDEEPSQDDGRGAAGEWRETIAAASEDQRSEVLLAFVREQVADVLGLSVSKISSDKSLPRMGIDSLQVVEVRVRLEEALELDLTDALVEEADDLGALADQLESRLDARA